MTPRRLAAVACAAVPALGALGLAWFLWFLLDFPFENAEPLTHSDRVRFGLRIAGAAAVFLLAVLSIVFIVRDRRRWAVAAVVVQAGVVFTLLLSGLSESEHSDGQLLGWAVGLELFGVLSVLVMPERRVDRLQ
jgi:hypothetical protein